MEGKEEQRQRTIPLFSSCLIGSPLRRDILSRVFVKRESKKLNLHLLQTPEHVKDKEWQVFLLVCAFADEVGEEGHCMGTAKTAFRE